MIGWHAFIRHTVFVVAALQLLNIFEQSIRPIEASSVAGICSYFLMKLFITALALTLVLSCMAPRAASTQSGTHYDFESVKSGIRQKINDHKVVSVAVAVAKDGHILWEEGFGSANREKSQLATPHTPYSLASISKPITATGLMTLVERNKVGLDNSINDYLGDVKIAGLAGDVSRASIRQVLSHTSGLPLHYHFFYENTDEQLAPMEQTIRRYGILVNPPGEVFEYSNLGYGILGELISRVSGQTYADFMTREVFLPLGMGDSFVAIGSVAKKGLAVRYDSQQLPLPNYDFDHRAASAIYSSADDLIRFGMFQLKDEIRGQRKILQPSTIDQMQRVATPPHGEKDYGFGWFVNDLDKPFAKVSHTGGMPGVSTVLNLYPKQDLAIVVLANSRSHDVDEIAAQIAESVLPEFTTAIREDLKRRKQEPDNFPKLANPPQELVGVWEGEVKTWEQTLDMKLVVSPDGEAKVKLGTEPDAEVKELSFKDGDLRGRFAGTIPTADARLYPHSVRLDLHLRNGKLSGEITAQTIEDHDHFALTSYGELGRVSVDTRPDR